MELVDSILAAKHEASGAEGLAPNFESLCGEAHSALADVIGLSIVLRDKVWEQRALDHVIEWEFFWEYGLVMNKAELDAEFDFRIGVVFCIYVGLAVHRGDKTLLGL